MMQYGSQVIEARPGARFSIRASGSFIVFACGESEQRLRILGPNDSKKRYFVCVVPACKTLEIEADASVAWEVEQETLPPRSETPDQTPVEIPVGFNQPESLESIMARMIETRFNQMAEERGQETFEEADDFDVSDEHELPKTPYEMVDMDPDEPFYPEAPQPGEQAKEPTPPPVDPEPKAGAESASESRAE